MSELKRLAELIGRRNEIEVQIAKIIERPAQIGHLGEFIASTVFKIELARSASQRGSDGTFSSGALSGRSVNIKWYSMDEGIIALDEESVPDYYLVLAGPRTLRSLPEDRRAPGSFLRFTCSRTRSSSSRCARVA